MKCPDCDKENTIAHSMMIQTTPPTMALAGYECECGTKWQIYDGGRVNVQRPLRLSATATFEGDIDLLGCSIIEVNDE